MKKAFAKIWKTFCDGLRRLLNGPGIDLDREREKTMQKIETLRRIGLGAAVVALIFMQPAAVKAGPLDLEAGVQWLIDTARERGAIATVWDWNGRKAVAGTLKYAVLHNKAKTRSYAAIMVGFDVTIEKRPEARFLLAPTVNVIECGRWVWDRISPSGYVTVMKAPKDWEIWAGVHARPPVDRWQYWTWKTHTGPYASLGKRFGGEVTP